MTDSIERGARHRRSGPARRTGRPGRGRRGYTIVAVIVSIVLLVVGLMALAGASAQTVTMQTLAQNRTNAIAIARAYLEQVRTRDPWSVVSEPTQAVDAEGFPAAGGPYRRTLRATVTRQNLLKVDVEVSFPRSSVPIQITTLLFRGNGLSGAP